MSHSEVNVAVVVWAWKGNETGITAAKHQAGGSPRTRATAILISHFSKYLRAAKEPSLPHHVTLGKFHFPVPRFPRLYNGTDSSSSSTG